jgi:hypothetical protein
MNDNDLEKKPDISEPPIQSLHTLDADILASIKNENYASNIVKVVTHDTGGVSKKDGEEDADSIGLHTLKQAQDKVPFRFNFNSTYFYVGLSVFLLMVLGFSTYYVIHNTIQDITPPADVATSTTQTALATTTSTSTNAAVRGKNTLINAEILIPIRISDLTKIQVIDLINKTKADLITKEIKNNINIGLTPDVSIENFFNKIQYSGPDTLVRSLNESKVYNFGLYHTKNNQFQAYILTKIDTFDLAFSGMLDWEQSMFIDFQNIFTYTPEKVSASSTQKTAQNPVITKRFTDTVIKNIDARIYTNENTKIIYGFINKEYILITSGEESFVDIVNKLTINNILR